VRAPFAWWWLALAALFSAFALWAASNYAVAVPAAAAAVLVAALALGDAVRRTSSPRAVPPRVQPVPTSGVRRWLAAGELGREDLILLLDRLERKVLRPDLPARTPTEIGALVTLAPQEFYRYVADRIQALEGTV
jgi:hypothetical protein